MTFGRLTDVIPRWIHGGRLVAWACVLTVTASQVAFGRSDAPWPGIRGAAGVHLGRWLSAAGGGIETPPSYAGVLAAAVRSFEASSVGRAEGTMRTSLDAMIESARLRGAARPPTWEFPVNSWVCGGCILVEMRDWADFNAEFWIEPWEFLGADPTDAVSRAFLGCRELTIETLDDGRSVDREVVAREPVVVARCTTDDMAMIQGAYRGLMLGLHCTEERWTPPDWEMVSPVDFTTYVGVRPSLRITMTGDVFLRAEIDARKKLAVIHTNGKRGVFGIDVVALLNEVTAVPQAPDSN